ncbi:MAG: hypothetical protein HOI25_13025 [Proteobacteria bacterium]|jgi:hypothetical protein|nr:hypothetical protein [Pseudomonadota bacterium]MDG1231417.1 hypothetical protein [Pseudomonadales bacterium]
MSANTKGVINGSTGIMDGTVIGPYEYAGSLKAFGFKADPEILTHFLKAYLQDQVDGCGYKFSLQRPEAPIVYMLITDALMQGGSAKDGETLGIYRNRSCQFHIPVRLEDEFGHPERGSLQVFSYGSSMQNALTSTEVRGPYMSHCRMLVRAEAEDLDRDASPQTLFELSPQVITPDLSLQNACLLSLEKAVPPENVTPAESAGHSAWRAFEPETVFSLKQFQHEKWPGSACYQALIKTEYAIGKPLAAAAHEEKVEALLKADWHEGDPKLASLCLKIYRYEFHPIVSALGLEVGQSSVCLEENGKVACDTLHPVSYLSLGSTMDKSRMPVTEKLGTTLCYRWRVTEDESQGWERPSD